MTTGRAHDETGGEPLAPAPWDGIAGNRGDHPVGGPLPHLIDGDVDRRKRAAEIASQGDVVEARHTDIGWNALSCLVERAEDANGHGVVAGKDRRWRRAQGEQRL